MSNKRKRVNHCSVAECYNLATIHVSEFDDDGTDRGSRWLCPIHAIGYARQFEGKIWGDNQCQCGHIDHIIEESGRSKRGNL